MNLALFDFDGTITFKDTFVPFVRGAVSKSRWILGSVLLSPLIALYELGWLSGTKMRAAMVRVAFSGRSESELRACGSRYASTLPAQVRAIALERIHWHQAQGDAVVVVSASLDVYLRDWCAVHGLELICAELEVQDRRMTGKYLGADCTGEEKARRVRARYDLSRYPTVYAYGDTAEDLALLSLASQRVFRWQAA
jgi:phosphatidylglycerophosphatase C